MMLAPSPILATDLPPPRLFRWEEDYRSLAARAAAGDPIARLKHLELADGISLSFGAQARATYERRGLPFAPRRHADDALLTRLLLHGDLRLGEHARVFLELGSHGVAGKRKPLAPSDENQLDLQQAFADVRGPLGTGTVTVRLGRQELGFDAQRFVTVRNGPNVRQAFDGLRADWTAPSTRLTAFAVQPVENRDRRGFDDQGDADIRFIGLRAEATRVANTALGAALYGYRYDRDGARFGGVRADETRDVLGARVTWADGGLDADLEAVLQGGRFAGREVRAWAIGSTAGWRLTALPWSPRFGLQFDTASGDDNPRDGRLATFNPLFPRGGYFTDAGYTGFANLIHLKPNLTLTPYTNTRVHLGAGWLWRQTAQDAVYAQPLAPVAGTAGNSGGLRIGSYGQVRVETTLARGTDLVFEAVYLMAGPALTASGGRDATYVKAEVSFRF
ncbi:MAG: alginate export family protein [Alphaproteobacteria bacterium]|nr:alginate export family protein [Alphaproteobacteria bacterium]